RLTMDETMGTRARLRVTVRARVQGIAPADAGSRRAGRFGFRELCHGYLTGVSSLDTLPVSIRSITVRSTLREVPVHCLFRVPGAAQRRGRVVAARRAQCRPGPLLGN